MHVFQEAKGNHWKESMWELTGHASRDIGNYLAGNIAQSKPWGSHSGQGKGEGTFPATPGTVSCPLAWRASVKSIRCRNALLSNPAKVPPGSSLRSRAVITAGPTCRQAGLSAAELPPPGAVAGPGRSACPSGTAQCFPSDPLDLLFASSNSLCSSCRAVSLAETNRSPCCLQRSCWEKTLRPGPSWGTDPCGEAQPDTVPSPPGEHLASSDVCWLQ